jgi:hypothetical protein
MSGANMTPTTRKLAAKELPTKNAACVITPRDEPPARCLILCALLSKTKGQAKEKAEKNSFFLLSFNLFWGASSKGDERWVLRGERWVRMAALTKWSLFWWPMKRGSERQKFQRFPPSPTPELLAMEMLFAALVSAARAG